MVSKSFGKGENYEKVSIYPGFRSGNGIGASVHSPACGFRGRGNGWGYDPVNYNVPEGSYSTDPYHGEVRVKEMKQMIKGLHDNGISVILDVVYNHVYNAEEFCFNKIVPGYQPHQRDRNLFQRLLLRKRYRL